jgi:hypothetical protein
MHLSIATRKDRPLSFVCPSGIAYQSYASPANSQAAYATLPV